MYHASIGMEPFQALYGRFPPVIPHFNEDHSPINEVNQNLFNYDDLLRQIKSNLLVANNRMTTS